MNYNNKKSDDSTNSNERKSIHSFGSRPDKVDDSIPFRIDLARAISANCNLDSMLFTDDCDTDAFMYPVKDDEGSRDTRKVLGKKLKDFYKVIKRIGGKLSYVKSGTTGHTFKGTIKKDGNTVEYAVKVVAYPKKEKYGEMYDITRPENAELMVIKLLSGFVVRKETPHIVLPLATFNCSIKPFVDLIDSDYIDSNNKKYAEFVEKYKNSEYFDHVSILISEWANRGDLLEFLRKNYKHFKLIHWKALFFQIISVLAVIQAKYPTFRHNDLKANNILLQKISGGGLIYRINGKTYNVPSIGYRIKLWDFDFACVDGIVSNAKVNADWTTHINITSKQNRYYDLHYFFNTLIKKGFLPQFMEDDIVDQEAKNFVKRLVPKKFREGDNVAKRGRILVDIEHTTPDKVLRTDPFFDEFRNNK
jgi:hypothetical protein